MEANIYAYMDAKGLHELCSRHEDANYSKRNTHFLEEQFQYYLGKKAPESRYTTGNNDHLIEVLMRGPEGHVIGQIMADNEEVQKGKRKVCSNIFAVKINLRLGEKDHEARQEAIKKFLGDFREIMSARTIGRPPEGDELSLLSQSGSKWQMVVDEQRMQGEVPYQYATSYWKMDIDGAPSSEEMKRELKLAETMNEMIGTALDDINASILEQKEETGGPRP